MLDYLAIGHIAQDLTPGGIRLGGTVSYATLTARALGQQTGLVTSAAADAVLDGLERVEIHRLDSPASTVFENVYTPSGRVQTLHARAGLLRYSAIPPAWRSPGIVHLAPIDNEVDPALAFSFPGAFVGLTPQGWMRRWDDKGRVYRGEWRDAAALLAETSATVISIEDVGGDWSLVEQWASAARVLVVTEGEQGASLYVRGSPRRFPAPAVTVVDATGAGDIFAAAFFVSLARTHDPAGATQFAIRLASDSVTRPGIAGVPQDPPPPG
jgi:sugar/nucleoside kinase (ribokinase family)